MTLKDFVISGSTSACPSSSQKLIELLHLKRANRNPRMRFKRARTRQREGTIKRLKGARSHAFKQQMPNTAMQFKAPAIRPANKQLRQSANKKENSAGISAFDKAN